jgi:hypothetical protein
MNDLEEKNVAEDIPVKPEKKLVLSFFIIPISAIIIVSVIIPNIPTSSVWQGVVPILEWIGVLFVALTASNADKIIKGQTEAFFRFQGELASLVLSLLIFFCYKAGISFISIKGIENSNYWGLYATVLIVSFFSKRYLEKVEKLTEK